MGQPGREALEIEQTSYEFSAAEVIRAVGPGGERYFERFQRLEQGRTVFSWPAFWVPALWFAYRRMPLYALGAAVLHWLCEAFAVWIAAGICPAGQQLAQISSLVGLLFILPVNVFWGLIATRAYRRRITSELVDSRLRGNVESHTGTSAAVLALIWLMILASERILFQPLCQWLLERALK